jgi:outer membrane protein assembly factor BamE (lipoprotein component of BamABCDE complex)
MKSRGYVALALVATAVALGGCMSAAQHRADVRDDSTDRVTVGKVQREIRVGMSSAQVAEVLGSPNVVTTDEKRREVWVYDKVATESAFSASSGGIPSLSLIFASGASVSTGPIYSQAAGAASTTQRTLTIIIKFDEQGKVRDFAYHNSQF